MTKSCKLSVVILSYNRIDELKKSLNEHCYDSLAYGYELIVVDNNSVDGSRELITEYNGKYSNLVYVLNDNNLGVAGGRNSGYAKASGEFVLSIDEDAHIKLVDILTLKNLLTSMPDVGIMSPKIVHGTTGEHQNPHGNLMCEVGNFHGACYMFRRSLIDEVGYLDGLCSFGGEELEYSIRTRSYGYSILYIPDVEVKHNNFNRTGKIGNDRLCQWLYNFVRIFFKFFPITNAILFTIRYFFSYVLTCLVSGNALVIPRISWAVVAGVINGLCSRTLISKSVTDFYMNPLLRPDIGNVPITYKIIRKIRTFYRKWV